MGLPTYSFLPWLRHGVANTIQSDDVENGGAVLRASVEVKMKVTGDVIGSSPASHPLNKQVQLYGPGDVVGIDTKAIVKVEPRHWITNFEPNYLPYIEFYDEDFPWRYTPAKPGAHHRLRPWVMLAVLKQEEFEEGKNILGKPLPFINVLKESTLPLPDDLWAWAHVHVNRSLNGNSAATKSTDAAAIVNQLKSVLAEDPDLASSRIICPRQLEENTTYHAFLVPVFESGRLAGLGREFPAGLTATKSAWGTSAAAVELPVYHRWQFSTGSVGDFEYLVRLLKPVTAKPELGRRDMDASQPGANLPDWQEAPGIPAGEETEGIFKLGGALRAPLSLADFNKIKKYELWAENAEPGIHPFQQTMAALLNLDDDYKQLASQLANQQSGLFEAPTDPNEPEDLDPVITPPIYGKWHAKVQRLLKEMDGTDLPNHENWIHELNLDPRFRTAAGFGTSVVQKNQEDYMFDAWKQIGDVLKGNQVIRQGQFSLAASLQLYGKHIEPMKAAQPQQFFFLTAPVHRRVITTGISLPPAANVGVAVEQVDTSGGMTISHALRHSRVSPAVVSPAMRRILRPGGRLAKRLGFTIEKPISGIIAGLNEGQLHAAPPKAPGAGTPTLSKDTKQPASPPTQPDWLTNLANQYPNLRWMVLVLAILLALLIYAVLFPLVLGGMLALIVLLAGYYLYWHLGKWAEAVFEQKTVNVESLEPETVEQLPMRPDFVLQIPVLTQPGQPVLPPPSIPSGGGRPDSFEAGSFREGLLDFTFLIKESKEDAARPPKIRLDLPMLEGVILDKIHPVKTIPPKIMGTIKLPSWLVAIFKEEFEPVMAYPKLDYPMYKPLEKLSSELFLPNIRLIENNTISLLKTNQKFIESYMVGLNHEFARELLWREYPTDQRGSSFRQFWDVSTVPKPAKFEPANQAKQLEATWRDKLYDIPEIHTWSKTSALGKHDHRELPGKPQEEEVVLVIRGELLKKYPTAVIYAQKAAWVLKPDGTIDKSVARELITLTTADDADLEDGQVAGSNQKLKTPLYSAKVDPDIYFFGFDLTVEEVQGAKGDEPDAADRPGWFFVIKERPGEPRFGLDIDKEDNELNGWNELSWKHVTIVNGTLDVGGSAPNVTLVTPTKDIGESDKSFSERTKQFTEDSAMTWSEHTNASELAYILYQVPKIGRAHV